MVVQEFVDRSGHRRVVIFDLGDGTFTFIEEKYSDLPEERCWLPRVDRRSRPICDSIETAIREAIGRVTWLTGVNTRG